MKKLDNKIKQELLNEIENVKLSANTVEGHTVDEITTLLIAALVEEEDSGGY